MSPEPVETQKSAQQQVDEKQQEGLSNGAAVQKEELAVVVEEVVASVAVVETKTMTTVQENGDSAGFGTVKTTGKNMVAATAAATPPANIGDMDEELLQEQAQAVVEELQKRGACTTLALAKMLGMEKSTQLNPLLYLLLEKNVVARVTDFPPIWSLSPTFPMSSLAASATSPPPIVPAAAAPVVTSRPTSPAAPPGYTSVQLQPSRIMAQQPQAVPRQSATGKIITFRPIPAERTTKPIITFPPIPADPPSEPASVPATSGTLQQQQLNADYWQSLCQMSGGKNNRDGGGGPPFKRRKKQKNLSKLQLRLLKELKERGPTWALELSKIVGLVTCRDVNPSIYDLKQRNLVVKVNDAPPVWQLNKPGMNRAQFKISGMDVDEDEDQFERENQPGASFGGAPIAVDSQGISSLSFFH